MEVNEVLEEFKKCKADPSYFISKYIKVVHPMRGLVPFELYPFQEKILKALTENRFNILRKFRQAGCTTLGSAYCLWMAIFQQHKTIVILSKGDTESTEVLDRIKIMYDELPEFLKPGIVEDNKHTLKLNSGSVIKSRPSGKQSGRSLAGSFLMIDEAAFIEHIDTIWAAVYPIISTGGSAFVLSTVNGVGNWYHDVYQGSVDGSNAFNCVDIRWQDHPEYHYNPDYQNLYEEMKNKGIDINDWEKMTRSNLPVRQWLQEYECSFLGTGDTYLDGDTIKEMSENISTDFKIKYNNRMRVWEEPEAFHSYLLTADCALGRGRDYSAFHIINLYNGNQVAEFYSNKTSIDDFAKIIAREGSLYNLAYVICERNTIGNNLIDKLFNTEQYENLWQDEKGSFGLQVSSKNREVLLANLEEAIRNNYIRVRSSRTYDEFNTFIIKESGRVEAEKGHHDDLVMSLSFGVHLYKELLDTTPMEHVSKIPYKEKPLTPSRSWKHTIKTPTGMTEEDYRWLIK
jgi:hypothetical protein